MKKLLVVGIVLVVIGVGVVLIFKLGGGPASGKGVLKVTSTPTATIFLDNQNIGKTPLEQKVKSGEYTLKLIPETTIASVVSWEVKIKVSANLLTYVNRELGDSELTSAGEMLSLEKIAGNQAELAVLSTPDGAIVSLNGAEKDRTPWVNSDLVAGSYDLSMGTPGYKSRALKIKTTNGYKVTATFQLAVSGEMIAASPQPSGIPSPEGTPKASPKPSVSPKASVEASSSAKPKPSPPAKPYVEILETPTGFLRVRAEAGSSAEEVSLVNPGELYKLLDETTVSGTPWYKIEYETDKEGWVSSQYA